MKKVQIMRSLYSSPLRVYIILGALTLWGILSATQLSTSLFPNSAQPEFHFNVNYGLLSAQQFYKSYGLDLESQLRQFQVKDIPVEKISAHYRDQSVSYTVLFGWGTPHQEAERELRNYVQAQTALWPEISRRTLSFYSQGQSQGFFAMSFYSPQRGLEEVFALLKPVIPAAVQALPDVGGHYLFNPRQQSLRIELNPEKMASLQLQPSLVQNAIQKALMDRNGGTLQTGENRLNIVVPTAVHSLADFRSIPIVTPNGRSVLLQQIADVQIESNTKQQTIFKTSGVSSILLFASPKPGGNIKKMSEDIVSLIEGIRPSLPADLEIKFLINPAEFIDSSLENVIHEVILAALLAVFVLYLFIGSLKNVFTAAVEIPLSLILAFILMRLTGMNLNLISLGGLALSAGMNVDASVVVMENIFRHFAKAPKNLSSKGKLDILCRAVQEVMLPVVASTIASLVVFIPLVLTRGLTNSILGDLAKAVVFSHGFSALVALVLVPTVRLQMLRTETQFHLNSPLEKYILRLEHVYRQSLQWFLRRLRWQQGTALVFLSLLAALVVGVLPRLPKEIIGRPDTDWIMLGIYSSTFKEASMVESNLVEIETNVLKEFGKDIAYTFSQIHSNSGNIMFKLHNKKQMENLWKELERRFQNTPIVNYWVEPWNPSEMPIPNPQDFQISISGSTPIQRNLVAESLLEWFQQNHLFPNLSLDPSPAKLESIQLLPFKKPQHLGSTYLIDPAELALFTTIATGGYNLGETQIDDQTYSTNLTLPVHRITSIEDLAALPLGLQGRILPLKAVSQIQIQQAPPSIYRENGRDVVFVYGRETQETKSMADINRQRGRELLAEFIKRQNQMVASPSPGPTLGTSPRERPSSETFKEPPTIQWEDSLKVLTDAIDQLKYTLLLATLLIFLTMVIQFGDIIHALLVMVAIPLGLIGVILSLFLFKSTLSLNAILGVILLNGIAVANSIILVDCMKKLYATGLSAHEAALQAAESRLRPILMTSLTTCLGMLPVALGWGEGGKVLQPLGISVVGGLWFSMSFTLFIVPTLQVHYLRWKESRTNDNSLPSRSLPRETDPEFPLKNSLTPQGPESFLSLIFWILLAFSTFLFGEPQAHALLNSEKAPNLFYTTIKNHLDRDPRLQEQRNNLVSAELQHRTASLFWTPEISASAGQVSLSTSPGSWQNYRGLSAQLNLFKFGADYFGLKAANAFVHRQEALLTQAQQQSEYEIAEILFERIKVRSENLILEEILKIKTESTRIAEIRFNQGKLSEQDVDKIRIDRETALIRLRSGQDEEISLINRYQHLVGGDLQDFSWPWAAQVEKPLPPLNVAVREIPLVQGWQYQSEYLDSQTWVLRSAFLPTLDFSASWTDQAFNSSGSHLENGEWTYRLALTIPLWNRFSDLAAYKNLKQQELLTTIQLQNETQKTTAQMRDFFKQMELKKQNTLSSQLALHKFSQFYQNSLQSFKLGRTQVNDLFVEQTRLLDAQLNHQRALYLFHRALVDYCHWQQKSILSCF